MSEIAVAVKFMMGWRKVLLRSPCNWALPRNNIQKKADPLCNVQRAVELANFGLAEPRRSAHNLGSNIVDESRLAVALQHLVERSSVAGLVRCDFRSAALLEKSDGFGLSNMRTRASQIDGKLILKWTKFQETTDTLG
jgi:signal transduction histidine kinase